MSNLNFFLYKFTNQSYQFSHDCLKHGVRTGKSCESRSIGKKNRYPARTQIVIILSRYVANCVLAGIVVRVVGCRIHAFTAITAIVNFKAHLPDTGHVVNFIPNAAGSIRVCCVGIVNIQLPHHPQTINNIKIENLYYYFFYIV